MQNTIPTGIGHQPTNTNFLSKAGFKLIIRKTPTVNFYAQRVNIPAIMLNTVWQATPFVKIPKNGDHLDYDPFAVTFKVDEDLKNYLEIYNWMTGLGFPDSFKQYDELDKKDKMLGLGPESDVSLFVLTSHRNPAFEVIFRDAAPISLSGLEFDATSDDVEYLESTVVFRYMSFTINPVT